MFPCRPRFALRAAPGAGLCFSAFHGAQVIFKRCFMKCQVALSVLHWRLSHMVTAGQSCASASVTPCSLSMCREGSVNVELIHLYGLTSVKLAKSHS